MFLQLGPVTVLVVTSNYACRFCTHTHVPGIRLFTHNGIHAAIIATIAYADTIGRENQDARCYGYLVHLVCISFHCSVSLSGTPRLLTILYFHTYSNQEQKQTAGISVKLPP